MPNRLSKWSDTIRSLNYSVAAGQSSYAPLIFFIDAVLGGLWGLAIAERELPPRSDALLVLAAQSAARFAPGHRYSSLSPGHHRGDGRAESSEQNVPAAFRGRC
jgi:hypothetical protein